MAENKENDEVADYSGYFKKPEPVQVAKPEPASPLQEIPVSKKFTRRAMILIVVLIVLVIAQIVLMLTWQQSTTTQIPEGYQIITPDGQPAFIEPIQ